MSPEKVNIVQITVWLTKDRGYKVRAALGEPGDLPDPPDEFSCDQSGRKPKIVKLLNDLLDDLKAAYVKPGSTTISLCVDDGEIVEKSACKGA